MARPRMSSVGSMRPIPGMSLSQVMYLDPNVRLTSQARWTITILRSVRGREARPTDLSSNASPSSLCKVPASPDAIELPCHLNHVRVLEEGPQLGSRVRTNNTETRHPDVSISFRNKNPCMSVPAMRIPGVLSLLVGTLARCKTAVYGENPWRVSAWKFSSRSQPQEGTFISAAKALLS